jgi:hypothetical protein
MTNEFIEEIREGIRQDELIRFWKKYGKWLIAGMVTLIMGILGGIYWEHYQHQQKVAKAHDYEHVLALLAEHKQEEALAILKKMAAEPHKGYALLSLFQQANLDHNHITLFQQIAEDPKIEQPFRDLANLIIVMRDLDHLDQDNSGAVLQKLQSMITNNSPWRTMATELLALALMRSNHLKEAQQVLESLVQDESAPQGVRMRAVMLLDYIRHG